MNITKMLAMEHLNAILSKEVLEGGNTPALDIGYEYPIDQKSWLNAEKPTKLVTKVTLKFQGSDLLSDDGSGTFGYYKNILGDWETTL